MEKDLNQAPESTTPETTDILDDVAAPAPLGAASPEELAAKRAAMIAKAKAGVILEAEVDDVINYAIQQHGDSVVSSITITNSTDVDVERLMLHIGSENDLLNTVHIPIDGICAGDSISSRTIKPKVNGNYLANLTEQESTQITLVLTMDDTVVAALQKDITALAFDQWTGFRYTPEFLVAFSLPNHPVVAGLMQQAAQYMEKWTGDPTLSGYQRSDPNYIKQMAAAAYAAIQKRNITYANPPASFGSGQRIRLADAVIEQHLGTCMDMTMLYCACLEAMGLNPIMVLKNGHIFAGVWLVDECFTDTIVEDSTMLQKRMSDGINELLVVECTNMCAGRSVDFDSAVQNAYANLGDIENFQFALDVQRARKMGFRPLPVRVKTESGFEVQHQERKESQVTDRPDQVSPTYDLDNLEKQEVTKQVQWERKLLDLSTRNMLVNLRLTKALVPLLNANISELEDYLSDGDEFLVLPKPETMGLPEGKIPFELFNQLGPFEELMALESQQRRLHSHYTPKELTRSLTSLYRSARSSMEENGASTLYLALGLLRWIEGKSTKNQHYAPIVLLPIEIVRKSGGKGFGMHIRDDEAQLNITLTEMLKQTFDLEVPGLFPLPEDEHGLDLKKIFAIFRQTIMNKPGWDVVEIAVIGNFSFSQFVMWKDIHSRSDILEKNDIVRSLVKGAIDWDCTLPEDLDQTEAYLPITADASQLRAIKMAAKGTSFVLHGPPGTGKSQTITALIANALSQGKTVLFVAEKMAALEVVQKRLQSLGIGDFCLELHSSKATKKTVLDQLNRATSLKSKHKSHYRDKLQEVQEMRAALDGYAAALHRQLSYGMTLRELIDLYETIPYHGRILTYTGYEIENLTELSIAKQRRMLDQLVAIARGIGHPHDHPLAAVQQTVYSQSFKTRFSQGLADYLAVLQATVTVGQEFANLLEKQQPRTRQDWDDLHADAKVILESAATPAMFLTDAPLDQAFDAPMNLLGEKEDFDQTTAKLLQRWNPLFLHADIAAYRAKYDDAQKKLFGKSKALQNLSGEIGAFSNSPVDPAQLPLIFAEIEAYQSAESALNAKLDGLSFQWKQILKDYPTQEQLQAYRKQLEIRRATATTVSSALVDNLSQKGLLEAAAAVAKTFTDRLEACKAAEQQTAEALKLSLPQDGEVLIDDRFRLCRNLLDNMDKLKDWVVYRQYDAACRENGLDKICDAYEAGLAHEHVMDVHLKSIYRAMILDAIESEPILNSFTGNGFNEQIRQFKKLDNEFVELTKTEIYYKLSARIPVAYESPQISKEFTILKKAIASNGRGQSIRSLFEKIPTILKRLSPCVLMSPISVAQYLSLDVAPYDIVIFDEASQLPTCKAVGVLARGKNAVVVGDPKQMPPTSFFAGNTVDEDNLDLEDLESILDDCLALGMPSTHLQWHYRSRHESLIAFSNHEFYESSMLTFPSVNDRARSVRRVAVEGFFDRKNGRINDGEARAIVEDIKRRYQDENLKKLSVGVVTFNISQQSHIEDLLQAEYLKDPELEKWATSGNEPLFVKNLENVQGDERDVILFSIAFAPDQEGKLSMNFGPLNREGGWKRLNVAITRSKIEMVVFSVLRADQIDLRRTKATGVEALKNFLSYAENGRLPVVTSTRKDTRRQGILNQICESIQNAGYDCQIGVGHSDFKVDIAVVNPYNDMEYLVGILLDGDSYKQSSNTRDREIAQISVLVGLGWDLHRIWTMDWWDSKQKELDKLLHHLEEAKALAFERIPKEPEPVPEEVSAEPDEVPEVTPETPEGEAEATLPDGGTDDSADNITAESGEDPGESTQELESVEEAPAPEVEPQEPPMVPEDTTEEEPSAESSQPEATEASSAPETTSETTEPETPDNVVPFEPKGEQAPDQPLVAGVTPAEPPVTVVETPRPAYRLETYQPCEEEFQPLTGDEFALSRNTALIVTALQKIIEKEAPISEDRLIRKTLRLFGVPRSTKATTEAVEKAIKKLPKNRNKQNGIFYYWRKDQSSDTYMVYRPDPAGTPQSDKRSDTDICLQELKNAICYTLQEKGPLGKDALIKETVKTMGYGRTSTALADTVERGIKFARKTEEIQLNNAQKFQLTQSATETPMPLVAGLTPDTDTDS